MASDARRRPAPRRGGPRFVTADERERAADLIADDRTNDQLSYDLLMDVLRSGALADAETVFGARQPGVRIVQVMAPGTGETASAHTEDYGHSWPVAAAAQRICDTGSVTVTLDGYGNPLNVGREHRLFTPRQRIALAIRDGGCLWHACDRRLRSAPTRRTPTHPAATPQRPHLRLGRHRPTAPPVPPPHIA